MVRIDPTARIEDGATLADDVEIGPFCIVGPHAALGAGCRLIAQVHITGRTALGAGCVVHPFSVLGGPPQSLSHKGEITGLDIGEGCTIRESVTMNAGTVAGGGVTRVGARGFFMAYSHVGHDCVVGNDVVFANSATLGGHCEVGDGAFIGGLTAVHQHVRIGAAAMVGGASGVNADIIPFGLASGLFASLEGLNVVGMRRRKFTKERLRVVRAFFRDLFHGEGAFAERLERIAATPPADPAVADILAFIRAGERRPLCLPNIHRKS